MAALGVRELDRAMRFAMVVALVTLAVQDQAGARRSARVRVVDMPSRMQKVVPQGLVVGTARPFPRESGRITVTFDAVGYGPAGVDVSSLD